MKGAIRRRSPRRPTSRRFPPTMPDRRRRRGSFPIVGIGASAGGLEAIGQVLKHLVADQMAFVVIQHLAPQYESSLTELLSRSTRLRVVTATDGLKIEPGRVYVIPPNADLAILHGVLHLMTPGAGVHLPIDFFFRSLAQDQGALGIGIVLSGTGTDGTYGLKAIKDAGGITMVQDPATAKYDGMPRSALDSGNADYCLTTEAIAAELNRINAHPYLARARIAEHRLARDHGQAVRAAALRVRHRLQLLQAEHHRAAGRAAHGAAEDRQARRLRQVSPRPPRGAPRALSRHSHQRHQLLPRRGALRGAQDDRLSAHRQGQAGTSPSRRSASGSPAARRARRPSRSPSACSSSSARRRSATASRSSAPTSTTKRSSGPAAASTRRTSPPTFRPSACAASSCACTTSIR